MENYIEAVKSAKQNHYLMCYSFALGFIKGKGKFTSEDIIEAYEKAGKPKPDEMRVFGPVIKELKKHNLIQHVGYSTAKLKTSHGQPINVWKSKI